MAAYRAKPPKGAMLNRSHRLAKGLVAAWLCNEGGGLTAYDCVGASHGTLTNFAFGASTTSNWFHGRYGKEIVCDGSNDRIEIAASAALNITSPLSVVSVFRNTTGGVGVNGGLFEKTVGGSINTQYLLFMQSGKVIFRTKPAGSTQTITGGTTVAANTNYVAIGTHDGANLNLYLNGKSDATAVAASAVSTGSGTSRIGHLAGTTFPLNGSLIATYVYNRALRPGEVRAISDDPFAMFRRRSLPVPLFVGGAAPATQSLGVIGGGVGDYIICG